MKYRSLKKRSKKIDLRKVEDYELYFEEIPPTTAYKIQRALSRSLRKLRIA